jgi:hypothetical protein
MKTFTIDNDNNITAFPTPDHAEAAIGAGTQPFTSQKQLAELTAAWQVLYCQAEDPPVSRHELVKGNEYEKDRCVIVEFPRDGGTGVRAPSGGRWGSR